MNTKKEEEAQNYTPSRFLLKKQQALIHQAQRLKSLKPDDQPPDHKIIFTLTPDLEKRRGTSLDSSMKPSPVPNQDHNLNKPSNLLDLSSRNPNNQGQFANSQKRDDRHKTNIGDNIKITFGMTNKNSLRIPINDSKDSEVSKPLKPSQIKKDTLYYPIELPLKSLSLELPNEETLPGEGLTESLFQEGGFALFQMPQILPFKEPTTSNGKDQKEKILTELPDEENRNELLSHLMKDNLDSMGHEINQPHVGLLEGIFAEEKKEKRKNGACSFDCEEGVQLGKLVIYRDGRAKMLFGEVEFELVEGVDVRFCQELMGLDFTEKGTNPKAYFLSNLRKKFICKPNLASLLD